AGQDAHTRGALNILISGFAVGARRWTPNSWAFWPHLPVGNPLAGLLKLKPTSSIRRAISVSSVSVYRALTLR
ncbi:hypothetical protein AB9F45_37870, partial [Rhizobium leguminosarum]|uniref:hypothetical protein n=1 Tax=Rhizobium leguminosarum TaxID=384 RepID=UPI003F9D5D0B